PAAQRIVEEQRRLAVRLERSEGAGDRPEQRLALEPRQQLPDAHMHAGAEADMAKSRAVDVVAIGFWPLAWIAVRRAQQHQHLLAFGDRDAAQRNVPRRRAEE